MIAACLKEIKNDSLVAVTSIIKIALQNESSILTVLDSNVLRINNTFNIPGVIKT